MRLRLGRRRSFTFNCQLDFNYALAVEVVQATTTTSTTATTTTHARHVLAPAKVIGVAERNMALLTLVFHSMRQAAAGNNNNYL